MNLSREQIISARDRARTKLARQRAALQATEAELVLWDHEIEQLDTRDPRELEQLDRKATKK